MLLSGGPSACDARLEPSSRTVSGVSVFPAMARTLARASAAPNGVAALNKLLARPSQKFRRLNTALITVGVFREVTCRTFRPPRTNVPAAPLSAPRSAADASATSTNVRLTTPADPTTSVRPRVGADALSAGLENV